jgi:ribose 5-phosphate isomerase A
MAAIAHDRQTELKRIAANAAVHAEVRNGMLVGLGTGSTALFVLDEIGRLVRDEGLRIRGVPTSEATGWLADERGIPLAELPDQIDLAIDGADEVDPAGNLTKGAGGAMTREKCVAAASRRLVIVVDSSKVVRRLAWPVPVEVLPLAVRLVERELRQRVPGAEPRLRLQEHDDSPFITDNGNQILDVGFNGTRPSPGALARLLSLTTGVVEHGLFTGMHPTVYIGGDGGVTVQQRGR